jgi:hypothetical protein
MKKEVEFDSDEMDALTLKLKNVRSVYTAHRVFAQFDGREPAYALHQRTIGRLRGPTHDFSTSKEDRELNAVQ